MRPPPGFVRLRRGRIRALVREDVAPILDAWLLAPTLARPDATHAFPAGRGGAFAFAAADGRRVVVREYRRGGWVARWLERTYVGWPPRPFRELAVTAAARARGVPTAEVLAARVSGALIYRGVLVTMEIPEARPALDALRRLDSDAARARAGRALGRTVGDMHRLGLAHADLNCDNLLLSGAAGPLEAWVIDLDRARLEDGLLARHARRAELNRLARSVRKNDPSGLVVTTAVREAFRDGYEEAAGTACAC